MFNKLKQFKDLRNQAKTIQNTLSGEKVEGTAAWGKVKIVMDGNQSVQSVAIDPSLLTEKTKLEEAVKEAVNDAVKKSQRVMAEKVKGMGGLKMPGLS